MFLYLVLVISSLTPTRSLKKHNISTPPREKRTRYSHIHKSLPPPKILLSTPEQETTKLGISISLFALLWNSPRQ
jgi:hypothetical protein